ncbi:MAG: quinol dehydrogenase ferredoxin subunit NapH [Acidobacteria bacterium RIFCSPLOWO2_12_FULL_67_14b]|nr:MAG: quinol dehydrogenase ferredoxin subunit NapH [Acidobacteria bacterium RIFCSPLOWO2_02_FULL_64_15]OFW41319.1 MAG: quinol dehydrogenase ferredoxin subunit NapH [Acidobacteria bacterium RIFCSPLOWO2_12_FULL_67_14b]
MKQGIGSEAIRVKGWFAAHQWLLARRATQFAVLALFLAGPWLGYWIVKGNLNYSLTLGVLPLADPYVLAQSLVAGHTPERNALVGAAVILIAYFLVGGRTYCAWVCPVNVVTDAAHWLRARLGVPGSARISRSTRYWILAMTLALALITGSISWELVNPVSMLHRGIIFGIGAGWIIIVAVFLLDLFVAGRAWCGRLCPVGAFYSAVGRFSPLRIVAVRREQCNDCADCYAVCPEPLVVKPALKGAADGIGPVILSPHCTNCGRCIDVCSRDVFAFGARFSNRGNPLAGAAEQAAAVNVS